jgi:hypothetical protein
MGSICSARRSGTVHEIYQSGCDLHVFVRGDDTSSTNLVNVNQWRRVISFLSRTQLGLAEANQPLPHCPERL